MKLKRLLCLKRRIIPCNIIILHLCSDVQSIYRTQACSYQHRSNRSTQVWIGLLHNKTWNRLRCEETDQESSQFSKSKRSSHSRNSWTTIRIKLKHLRTRWKIISNSLVLRNGRMIMKTVFSIDSWVKERKCNSNSSISSSIISSASIRCTPKRKSRLDLVNKR